VIASRFASTLEVVRDLVDVEIVGNHDVVESVERVAPLVRNLERAVGSTVDQLSYASRFLSEIDVQGVTEPMLRVAAEELVLDGTRAVGVVIDEIKVRAEGPVVRIQTHD
jgi:hypothetical protein